MSELVVNKSKKGDDLLVKHLLPSPDKSFRPQTGKPKPRAQTRKKPYPEDIAIQENISRDELA